MDRLTKDARLVLSCIYRKYRAVRSQQIPKSEARIFESDFYLSEERISSWLFDDVQDAIEELARIGFVEHWLDGSFELLDAGINAVEQRLPDNLIEGIIDVASIIASLLPSLRG